MITIFIIKYLLIYILILPLSALVGFGVTVTLSLREGPVPPCPVSPAARLVYRSADTCLMIALELIGPYR